MHVLCQQNGCLVDDCPFKHDDPTSLQLRAGVLEERRQVLMEPTPKQRMKDTEKLNAQQGIADARVPDLTFERCMMRELKGYKPAIAPRACAYCANLDCVKPALFAQEEQQEEAPLQQCSRCKWTCYCSVECQTEGWDRHGQECAPIEEVVLNNKLWSYFGTRIGTEVQGV